jgi:hypothetical protein
VAVVDGEDSAAHGEHPPAPVGVYPERAGAAFDSLGAEHIQARAADMAAVQRAGAVGGHVLGAVPVDGDPLRQDAGGVGDDIGARQRAGDGPLGGTAEDGSEDGGEETEES